MATSGSLQFNSSGSCATLQIFGIATAASWKLACNTKMTFGNGKICSVYLLAKFIRMATPEYSAAAATPAAFCASTAVIFAILVPLSVCM